MVLAVDGADEQREIDALRIEVAELRASRLRLALDADAERRGIERALHEGVQQLLVALATGVELTAASVDSDPASAMALLADMRRDVQQAMEEARMLAERVSPPLLDVGGLGVALRSAAAQRSVLIRIDVGSGAAALPPQIAGLLYACCLDVLDRIDEGTSVRFTVRDDGEAVSFEIDVACVVDPGTAVRDRVEALEGHLSIHPGDHQTMVAGSLPLGR